ncbi:hypothetical protein MPTK2_1g21290 [Marchantia polymorpha subsp. ruderalis]
MDWPMDEFRATAAAREREREMDGGCSGRLFDCGECRAGEDGLRGLQSLKAPGELASRGGKFKCADADGSTKSSDGGRDLGLGRI